MLSFFKYIFRLSNKSTVMTKLIALFLLCTSLSAMGATYYVAPDGSDGNNGDISQPFATLNKAWTVVMPGDIIYLRGGTYDFRSQQTLTGKNGLAEKVIKVWAYPGENPILSRNESFSYSYYCGIFFRGNYFHFKGIEITGYRQLSEHVWSGLRVEDSNNNIFELLNIHHNGHGFYIYGNSDNNLVLNCDFHHNQDPLTVPYPYDNADGISIAYIPYGNTNTVRGCRFWWNSDDGSDLWNNEGKVIFDSCWAWYNGYLPDTYTHTSEGIGFKLGQQVENSEILRTITRCVAFMNRAAGFTHNTAICKMELYNNIAYKNGHSSGSGSGFEFWWPDGVMVDYYIKNNIAYDNITKEADIDTYTNESNNTWNGGVTLTNADFINLDETQLFRPRNSDGSLPDIDFLHLEENSDLIDAGTDVGLPYNGNAPDLGAFEYGTYIPPIIPIPVNTGIAFYASPKIIELYFNHPINSQIVPSVNNFTVVLNGSTNFDVASVSISEFVVRLTLDNPVNTSGTLSVSYSKTGTNVLQSWAGGEVENFSAQTSVNIEPPIIPIPINTGIAFYASPKIIELYFNHPINSQIVPSVNNFTVVLNGSTNFDVASVSISEFVVRLTLDNPVNTSGTLSVSYSKTGTNVLQSWAGGEVENFTTQTSVNIETPPVESITARIFPSPTGEYITIHILGAPITTLHFIRFYDTSGELVYEDTLKTNASSIPISFPSGVYLVDIGLGNKILYSQRIVLN